MYDILEAIYVFFYASTKRCKVMTDLLQEVVNGLQLKNLSKTCWTARPESKEAVWRSLEAIIEALKAFYFLSMRMKQSDWLIRLSQRAVFLHPARCEMQPARCEMQPARCEIQPNLCEKL